MRGVESSIFPKIVGLRYRSRRPALAFALGDMMETEIFSPAKINLTLAITGKRSDGFHGLTSLVAPVSFGDQVSVRALSGGSSIVLTTNNASLPVDESNIAWRAADRFLKRFGIEASIEIRIEKRIPIGAGLGGGSSNGSAVLSGLAKLFDVDDFEALTSIATELGSDCPLFLRPEPLIMRGRGEVIERLGGKVIGRIAGKLVVLFNPGFGISTAWAYGSLAASPQFYANESEAEAELAEWKRGERPLESLLMNSFDEIIGRKYPSIPLLLECIRKETGATCLMSGSGSSCFAFCDGSAIARIRSIISDKWGQSAFFEAARIWDI